MSKARANVAVVGHYHSGKSTLLGHLFYKLGGYTERTLINFEKEAVKIGKESFKYAWILDAGNERKEGNTTTPKRLQFSTQRTSNTYIDTSGLCKLFSSNVSAIMQADVALFVVSATTGEFESGLKIYPYIGRLLFVLGVRQIILPVNKQDATYPPYSRERYEEVKQTVSNILLNIGFTQENLLFIPTAGWNGLSLVEPPTELNWYSGPTLYDALDNIKAPEKVLPLDNPLRVAVQELVTKDGAPALAAWIASGIFRKGTQVIFAPGGYVANVTSIATNECNEYQQIDEAPAGTWVTFTVDNLDRRIKAGAVASDPTNNPAFAVEYFDAEMQVFYCPQIIKNASVSEICYHSGKVRCKWELKAKLDNSGQIVEENPQSIKTGDVALVRFSPDKPVCVEPNSSLSTVIYSDKQEILVSGVVKAVKQAANYQ